MTEQKPEAPAVPGVTRWRHKTTEVEAVQWTGENDDAIRALAGDVFQTPRGRLAVRTPGGYRDIAPGDWVSREDGALFCCAEKTFAYNYEPAGEEKAPAVPSPPVAAALDREALGRIVHETRLACEEERAALEGRKKFNLEPWERRTYEQQETDMRMAEAVAAAVLGSDEKGPDRG